MVLLGAATAGLRMMFPARFDTVRWRAVKTGASSISRVQIIEGAAEGDAVALPTDFTLRDGDKVAPVYP